MRRMIPAAEAMPRMMAGKMNWSTYPVGFFENSTNRASGVQPHQIAGSRITTMAWTKPGIDSPRMAALRPKKSSTLSWRTADRTPTGMPIRTATAIAITPRVTVTGRRRPSSESTGWWVQSDSPRLVRTIAPSHSKYCT